MTYKEYIEELKSKWIGKKVSYKGETYNVVDVDYNGLLLIDRPTYYCESYTATTTAISPTMIDKE